MLMNVPKNSPPVLHQEVLVPYIANKKGTEILKYGLKCNW